MNTNTITKNHIEYRNWQKDQDYQIFDTLANLYSPIYRVNHAITANHAKTWLEAQDFFEPSEMIIVVEKQQQPIALLSYYPIQLANQNWLFRIWVAIHPEWTRSSAIAKAFVQLENKIRHQAQQMQCEFASMECVYQDTEKWRQQLLESRDFTRKEFHFELSTNMENCAQVFQLPKNLTIQPADCLEKELQSIDFSFHSIHQLTGYEIKKDNWIAAKRKQENYNPFLWKIIWDRENIVGVASNYIDQRENQLLGVNRGYIEKISCHPKYKNTNLTNKLFAESIQMFKDMGVEEVIYDVDILNEAEELTIAESFGFQAKKYTVCMQKEIDL